MGVVSPTLRSSISSTRYTPFLRKCARPETTWLSSYRVISSMIPKHETMQTLYRSLKKNATSQSSIGGLILSGYDSGKPQGWLAQLSWLRNRTVHEEPIRSLVETKLLTVGATGTPIGQFLKIYLGVPTDPKNMTNKDLSGRTELLQESDGADATVFTGNCCRITSSSRNSTDSCQRSAVAAEFLLG
jgi:hypothetical protein